ncbi:phage antirepressor [Companilactobacillus allii]|uniref:Phage repressor protein/antirepressor Ant n=1 Tax=Companilactobacillus allii TaxID=1847728 RepID=A0A1P8Q3M3_9LACO|nr:phage antirepressor [Companilactobacillus allii]APX72455.1 phage repressor protein/antirepressor Ant [Companilactobacillus allii]USQ69551.1 phage antirepressor [Companilactobacillus allii]
MNNLQEFNFKGNNVRTVQIDNEPYFVGNDVANVLGYSRSRKAIQDHVDNDDKCDVPIQDAIGRNQNTTVINESGLYSLILSSKLPTAKEFKHWVTSEVLPSIRKHGAYLTDSAIENTLTDPDYLIRLATQLKTEREGRLIAEKQAKEMKPKAIFADSVTTSNSTILVGELAKILKGNGVEIGQNRLFKWLRENGYLIKRHGADYNSPTQKSMDMGLFKIKESSHVNGNGVTVVTKTPKVTGRGQQYFINKFLNINVLLEV